MHPHFIAEILPYDLCVPLPTDSTLAPPTTSSICAFIGSGQGGLWLQGGSGVRASLHRRSAWVGNCLGGMSLAVRIGSTMAAIRAGKPWSALGGRHASDEAVQRCGIPLDGLAG